MTTLADPTKYDVIHLGVSGGKDSTAVLLWYLYESAFPLSKLRVSFCDTGNEDPLTYAFLAMLQERLMIPIHVVFPELDIWELSKKKKRFPSRKARFCTQMLKIIPTRYHVFRWQQQGQSVLLLNGVRKDEGHNANNRGQVAQFGVDDSTGCDIYRPILHWSINHVWSIHKKYLSLDDVITLVELDQTLSAKNKNKLLAHVRKNKIPRNPLYDMGARRVGCFPCINSNKAEVRLISQYRPEKIDFIEDQEKHFDTTNGISTFFARKTVPEAHRSKEIVTTKGEKMMVATIRDVVRWSKTAYGGKQFQMDLDMEPASACDIGGFCE